MTLRLRPHHILCCIGYEGEFEGYDAPFITNLARIAFGSLRGAAAVDEVILITGTADAICAPCPRRRGLDCETPVKVGVLDADHGAALGIGPGDRLTWGECLERTRKRIAPEDLDHLCAGCSWLPSGTCKAALARLREGPVPEHAKGRPEAALSDGTAPPF